MAGKPPLKRGERRDISGDLAGHRLAEQGKRYWSNEGTSKGKVSGVTWGAAGDFAQCRTRMEPHLGAGAAGYCAEMHHRATGAWPGHAPGEKHG